MSRSRPRPYCYEAVEVDVTMYHENGRAGSRLRSSGRPRSDPRGAAPLHDRGRGGGARPAVEKDKGGEVTALVNDLFDRDWKERLAAEEARARLRGATLARAEKTCTKVLAGPKYPGFDTLSRTRPVADRRPAAVRCRSIQTAAYVFRDTEHAACFQHGARPRHSRSRIDVAVLEERVAALEGGVARWRRPPARRRAPRDRDADDAAATCRLDGALRRLAQPARLHAQALRDRDDFRLSKRSENFRRALKPNTGSCS